MEDEQKGNNKFFKYLGYVILGALLILGAGALFRQDLGTKSGYASSDCESEQEEISDLQDKLDEANEIIRDAKDNAWSSYDDMGNALDDMDEVY